MPKISASSTPKKPRPVIGFRHSEEVKARLIDIANKENLDPATVYRKVFNAGLYHLYDWEIFANELVDKEEHSNTSPSS